MSGKEPRWIVIAVVAGMLEAEMIAERLRRQKIPVFVKSETLGSVLALTVGPLAKAQVLVPEEFEIQALDMLVEPDNTNDVW